jgi:hypothetical protein
MSSMGGGMIYALYGGGMPAVCGGAARAGGAAASPVTALVEPHGELVQAYAGRVGYFQYVTCSVPSALPVRMA